MLKLPKIEIIFLSFFGIGFAPKAPGTMGSLATLPILYLLSKHNFPAILLVPFLIMTIFATVLTTNYYQKKEGIHDPSWIVMDEVLGMLTSWCFYPTGGFIALLFHFILFRIFDIFKPGPIGYIDRHWSNGLGVVFDDILSGCFSGLIVAIGHFIIEKYLT